MTSAGIAACAVDRASLPQPFDRLYEGGVYYAGNGEIDPGAFLRELAGRLAGDVSIFERTRVCDLVEEEDGAVRVRCAGGSVLASAAVVATNAYTSALLPAAPIEPTRGQVAATGPLPRVVVPFPMYADRGFQYWRQTAQGQLVAGGWRNLDMAGEVGIEEALAPHVQSAVAAFIAQVSSGARVERQWAGIMGFTPDHFPLVGPVPGRTNTWLAAGYSGHGVAMAFPCGALAARASLGLETAIPAAFSPARFSTLL
jgi:glycine/D-amino acid oxidase-like deaminating enzyme